jgi:hypothetical protein
MSSVVYLLCTELDEYCFIFKVMVDNFSKALSIPAKVRLPQLWPHVQTLASRQNWSWLKTVFPRLQGCFDRLIEHISSFCSDLLKTSRPSRLRRQNEEILQLADDVRTACIVFNDFIQPLNELVKDGKADLEAVGQLEAEVHRKMMGKRKWLLAEMEKLDAALKS